MALDPINVTTVSIDQLPTENFNVSNYITHGVGADLKKNTVQALADFLTPLLGAISGIGFRAVSVPDGGTLPATTQEEFILVGAGTFENVGGGADITTTEQLNALVSNGTYWFIGVEIPIDVEVAGITQFIRAGFTETAPSENAVFNAFADLAATAGAVFMKDFPRLTVATQNFTIPTGTTAKWAQVNQATWYPLTANNTSEPFTFTQSGNVVTFKTIQAINKYIVIFYV